LHTLSGGDRVVLALGVGEVPVTFEATEAGPIAWMTPPAPRLGAPQPRDEIAALVGLSPDDLDARLPVCEAEVGVRFVMIPLTGLSALRRARLDVDRVVAMRESGRDVTGLYLFCRESYEPGRQVACRMLWEANGAREDAATGSACVCLGGYAARHDYLGAGDVDALVEQGVEVGRPSLLRLRVRRGKDGVRIHVGGRSEPFAQGTLVGVADATEGGPEA
jgi:trans-2,3-dihydro-3-hydroxyanthranilate isomerase